MSSPLLETFLARLYTDQDALTGFLQNPEHAARCANLSEAEIAALKTADLTGLQMAAASYAAKRDGYRRRRQSIRQRLRQVWARLFG